MTSNVARGTAEYPGNVAARYRLMALFLSLGVLLFLYLDTALSMVKIWNESETFAHGFLILPISLYIIYENRQRIADVPFNTYLLSLPAILLTGAIWWLAKVIDIQVVYQFAFVALIILVVLFFLGWSATKVIGFPLLFLFLAVPFGNGMIPHMIDMTADFVVFAIRAVGIPVYREGTYFIMPSGSWSVVSGCSGMRYLMATITVGLLFAYMNYRSLKRRIVFMIAACIVALVANWLRAFGIVMIAHHSGMKLALGVDHYIYGWVFFGIIVFALMGLGRIWQEDPIPLDTRNHDANTLKRLAAVPLSPIALVAVMSCSVMWPIFYNSISQTDPASFDPLDMDVFTSQGAWITSSGSVTSWKPDFVGQTSDFSRDFTNDKAHKVGLNIVWYPVQGRDSEIITTRNRLVHEKHKIWRRYRHGSRITNIPNGPRVVLEKTLKSESQRLLVWEWYWIAGHSTTSALKGKLYEALGHLSGKGNGGAATMIYTELEDFDSDFERARTVLKSFLTDFNQPMQSEFERALSSGS